MRLVCLGVGFALLLSAVAHAHPRINHVRPIAAAHFPKADERCGWVNVEVVPAGRLHRHADATPALCRIRVSVALTTMPRQFLCDILTHEFGHIDRTTGRENDPRDAEDHSANPRSIMYGGHMAFGTVPGCASLGAAESKLEALREHARALRSVRSHSRSRKRRRSINRRLASVKRRAAHLRVVVGP